MTQWFKDPAVVTAVAQVQPLVPEFLYTLGEAKKKKKKGKKNYKQSYNLYCKFFETGFFFLFFFAPLLAWMENYNMHLGSKYFILFF